MQHLVTLRDENRNNNMLNARFKQLYKSTKFFVVM